MDRRAFIRSGLLGAAAAVSANSLRAQSGGSAGRVTAQDVHDYLMRLGPWVDLKDTVDTFKAGDPATVVKKMAVAWMSYTWALRQAVEQGCNLFVCHEPTFYDHVDKDESVFAFEAARKKREFVRESKLVIVRCHDVWDRVEKEGIPSAWAEFLGLTRLVRKDTFCHVYEVPSTTVHDFAREVAAKVAFLGQQAVELIGPESKQIRTVAIGTGAITPFRRMVGELKADLVIATDDGFCYWRDGALAVDMEYPVIVVHHGCSEEFGLRKLADHLTRAFPAVPVMFIPEKCMFKTIA
ncbi:MAG: Nif3-like dinuclear metal center hexameric protein [Phycisphaerae bacterium]|nr:Nif3-like dinuclear metal center hexameric protein [Phycisphaerae bacterium]